MKHYLYTFAAWAMLFGMAQVALADGVPAGYYDQADDLKGKELKVALGSILRDHTVLSYSSLWSHYEVTDVVIGTTNQVFDYYSPDVYYFTGNGSAPSGANKEHACPQSWWGGGSSSNCYSDLFNVMPSESKANSAKSNYPLGTTSNPSYSNGRIKVGNSNRSVYNGKVFEPADEFKGDFARLYFYVATCYANAAWGSKSSVASTCAFEKQDYPTIKSWILDLLLEWNAEDPVSEWEMTRQERVYGIQHNRNPFIDYPQLADYIWGDSTNYVFDFDTAVLHGGASGGAHDPNDDPNDDPDDDPDDPDDPDDSDLPDFEIGDELLADTFVDIEEGDDYTSSGSSKAWDGNDNFPEVNTCYQAGGAVRVGKSKGIGSLTTRRLGNAKDATIIVEVSVKGWTAVEGTLLISADGSEEQELSYTATMSDSYQKLAVALENCSANAKVTIKTSNKRCFLDDVTISLGGSSAISTVISDVETTAPAYNLYGQPCSGKGLMISGGKVILVR